MARPRTRIPLNVFLNGRLVGRLNRQSSGAIDFRYDPSWLEWPHALPVSLSMPLREDRYIGDPVIAVFDNLLPDNDEIRGRLAQRVGAGGNDAYSLLTAVGRDCVGALQFLPDGVDAREAGKIEARAISTAEVASILGDLGRAPLGLSEDREFRISLAGAQEKTALLFWKDQWHVPHGTTATTHILKPQIGKLSNGIDLSQSVENEHLCMAITAALGLPTAPTQIVDFDGKRALVVERFDRLWTRDERLLRVPQEDFCQALSVPPSRKYEADEGPGIRQLLNFLKGSDEPAGDQQILLRAVIAFWLLGATDGHAKNFSLRLMPGARFKLTPLYDVLSTQPYFDAGQLRRKEMRLAMAVGTNRHYVINEVMPRHFVQTAHAAGISPTVVNHILNELHDAIPTALDKVQARLPQGFPEQMADSIFNGIRSRAKVLTLPMQG